MPDSSMKSEASGGETGIRTLGTREGSTVFETAPFDHSGISPHQGTAILAVPRLHKWCGEIFVTPGLRRHGLLAFQNFRDKIIELVARRQKPARRIDARAVKLGQGLQERLWR